MRANVGAALLGMFVVLALVAPASHVSGKPSGKPRKVDDLRGAVVDDGSFLPVAGAEVVVGGARATTDLDGKFSLPRVPAVYEAVVISADRAVVSIYRGLRRRDPLLVLKYRPAQSGHVSSSTLGGTVTGGGPFPLTVGKVVFAFFSPEAHQAGAIMADVTSYVGRKASRGPQYGPIDVRWMEAPTTSGTLTALQTIPGPDPMAKLPGQLLPEPWPALSQTPDASFLFARRALTLADGKPTEADLQLAPVPSVHLTGRIATHRRALNWPMAISADYVFPYPQSAIRVASAHPAPKFDYVVPDLRGEGGQLCVTAFSGSYLWISNRRCDVVPGEPVSLPMDLPPKLLTPVRGDAAVPGMRVAWTGPTPAAYELKLEAHAATPENPSLRLYTEETETTWPDLSALGIPFPEGAAAYECTIGRVGPQTTVDDLAGPQGIGARISPARFESATLGLPIITRPVTRAPDGGVPEADGVACQDPGTVICAPNAGEYYRTSAINRKLRHYPGLAAALGTSCVRDCAGARAYLDVYAKYQQAHPRFDVNEPCCDKP